MLWGRECDEAEGLALRRRELVKAESSDSGAKRSANRTVYGGQDSVAHGLRVRRRVGAAKEGVVAAERIREAEECVWSSITEDLGTRRRY